ncbi:MAG: hypothetical protein Q8N53_19925 [Longimicrobiales bacterium]|nr:hypothetical protein [Longimicrobiales bacterium]
MRRILAIVVAILIVALVIAFNPLGAQATDTERAAASSVLRRIEELQVRLDPMGTAARLASRRASWSSPAGTAGPTLGLIGEYDALRGTQGNFHGDQPTSWCAATRAPPRPEPARASGHAA